MKAQDLRVGNFYQIKDWEGGITTRKVKGIEDLAAWKHFLPIPISDEWLGKFGIPLGKPNKPMQYYFDEGALWQDVNMGGYDSRSGRFEDNILCCRQGGKIEYVHQLQSLYYSLTGKELKIKSQTKG